MGKIWQNQQNSDLKLVQGAAMNLNRSLQPSENAPIQSAAHGFASTVVRRADTSRESEQGSGVDINKTRRINLWRLTNDHIKSIR